MSFKSFQRKLNGAPLSYSKPFRWVCLIDYLEEPPPVVYHLCEGIYTPMRKIGDLYQDDTSNEDYPEIKKLLEKKGLSTLLSPTQILPHQIFIKVYN